MRTKGTITCERNEKGEYYYRYFDKNGVEIHAGDTIQFNDKRKELVYLTADGELGTDATNPEWIKSKRAEPCEYGIYPLTMIDMHEVVKVEGK